MERRSRAHFPIAPGRSGYRSVRLAAWIAGYPYRVPVTALAGKHSPNSRDSPEASLEVIPCLKSRPMSSQQCIANYRISAKPNGGAMYIDAEERRRPTLILSIHSLDERVGGSAR